MSNTSSGTANSTATDQAQTQNLTLRIALNDAYAFITSQKAVQTASAITFEECLDAQINTLTGPDTPSRPNVYNRITKIGAAVTAAVKQIMDMPDDAFVEPDPSTDVNTPALQV